jgi:hypothetical protein
MKKKPRKRTGTRLALLVAMVLAAFFPLAAAPKKKADLNTYAVLSGSIFQASGYALPAVAVTVTPESDPGNLPSKAKLEAVSDARGEFVLRVPPGPIRYTVVVNAKGYQTQRKTVKIEGQERVEVTFQLERESNQVERHFK